MSSINMHLCMANRLKTKFNLDNFFIFGQILPDLMVSQGKSNSQTHYLREYVVDGFLKKLPNVEQFEHENRKKLEENDPVILGYLVHLIQDKIWYNDFICLYAKYMPIDRNIVFDLWQDKPIKLSEFNKRIYHDYAKIDRYQLQSLGYTTRLFLEELATVPQACDYVNEIEQKVARLPALENTANYYISDYDADRYMKRAYKESIKALKKYMK